MIFYQCKCGERTSWSSMGVMSCVVCEKCGSTLAEGPNAHLAPQPHKWELQWHIDAQYGERWQERVCVRMYPPRAAELTMHVRLVRDPLAPLATTIGPPVFVCELVELHAILLMHKSGTA